MSDWHESAMALPPEPRWDNSSLDFGIWIVANHARLVDYAAELSAYAALPPGDFFTWAVEIHVGQVFRCQQSAFNDAPQSLSQAHALRTV